MKDGGGGDAGARHGSRTSRTRRACARPSVTAGFDPDTRRIRSNLPGVVNRDPGETAEVGHVEGEEVADTVDMHCRCQAGVMHLDSGYSMRRQETTPFGVDGETVGKQRVVPLDEPGTPIRLVDRQAESASRRGRPGRDVPELSQDLRG